MIKLSFALLLCIASITVLGQESAPEKSTPGFLRRIFLPSVDVGYQMNLSDQLKGSVKLAASLEYRIKNNNNFFVRLTYDTYNATYNLEDRNNTSNTIEGTVLFTDLFLAPGYRFGDKTYRMLFSVMPGIKFYQYPTASFDGQGIQISQREESLFTTTFLTTLEYYFDDKSAFTLSAYQNQVWQRTDFWENSGSALGFSFGFITSLK